MDLPSLGIGVGLRPFHYEEIFSGKTAVDWFEIISENFMGEGGRPQAILEKILEQYPVVMHGVTLAIGSAAPLDWEYLSRLKKLARKTKTPWLSDHLSWGRQPGAHYHDLLPLPYTQEVIDYVVERAKIIQDYLEIPFALENLSSYLTYHADEMPEWEFYREVVEKADILMMLDVNNIYVSSQNHGFDPEKYLEAIPYERVVQIHLAGHQESDRVILDTHDNAVKEEVWRLYAKVYPRTKQASTLLEWDDRYISFEATVAEANKARAYQTVGAK